MNLLKIVRKVITIGILIVIPVITHALPARSPDFWTCPFCHALKAKVPGVVEVGTCLLDTLHHGDFGLSFVLAGHCSYFAQVKKSMQSHLESSKLWKAPKRGLDREHTSGILFISVKFQNVWDTQSSQPDFTGIYCLNWQIMETMDYKYKYKYMHITNSMIYIYIYMFIHCGALGPWHSFLLHPLLDLDEVVLVHWNTAQSTMARLSEPRPPRDGPTSEGHSNSCWACPHPQGCRSGSASSPPWPDRSSSDLAKCPWGTRMIKGDILMFSILIYIIYIQYMYST